MTNILVVGDEEQFGRLVNRSLSRVGYTKPSFLAFTIKFRPINML